MSKVKFSQEPVFYDLKSLVAYLEKFVSQNPDAVQLDKSVVKSSNPSASIYFFFEQRKRFFQINGDTSMASIIEFLRCYKSKGNDCLYYDPPSPGRSRGSLKIKGFKRPMGWYCYEYDGFLLPDTEAA